MSEVVFGSVCSGIEAASVAWHPLGWRCGFVSDIDAFPCALLKHRYPGVPNLGDMTKFKEWPDAAIDVLVGGTPCQSFSVAGLRKGLDDPRGNLALVFLAIARRYAPRWIVWENVPGVLSDKTNAFGQFVAGLLELGYGVCWRVLDAQYFGVPQRRRRVFVVGYLGDWRRAAAVLFERDSVQGHPAPGREKRERVAAPVAGSLNSSIGRGTGGAHEADFLIHAPAGTLTATYGKQAGQDLGNMPGALICMSSGQANAELSENVSTTLTTLTTLHEAPIVAHSLRADGFDAGEDGTGRGTPLIAIQERAVCENPDAGPDGAGFRDDGQAYTLEARTVPQAVAFDTTQITSKENYSNPRPGDPCHPLAAGAHPPAVAFADVADPVAANQARTYSREGSNNFRMSNVAVAFESRLARNGRGAPSEIVPPLKAQSGESGKGDAAPLLHVGMQVRRLTPRECERLQGFPDDYTLIPYRGKPAADGPRYKALGNSMAVPVMRWIGQRIQDVRAIP